MIIKYTKKKSIGGGLKWDRFQEKTKSAFTKTKTGARIGIGAPVGAAVGIGKDIFKAPKRLIFAPKRAGQLIKLGTAQWQLKSKVGFNASLLTQKLDKYKTKTQDLQEKIEALQKQHSIKLGSLKTKGKNTRAKEEKYAGQMAELKSKLIARQQKTEDYIGNKLTKTRYKNVLGEITHGQTNSTENKIKKFRDSVAKVMENKTKMDNEKLTKKITDKIQNISKDMPAKLIAKTNAANKYDILTKIEQGTANYNEVAKYTNSLKPILGDNFLSSVSPGKFIKLSLEQRKLLTAAIPKALKEKFSAEAEFNKIASIKAKLEKAKSRKLEKEGLGALEQRVARRRARFEASQAKYGFLKNTVKTAKVYAGLTSPYNKANFTATTGIERSLENAKTAKQTYKKSKRNKRKLEQLQTNVNTNIDRKNKSLKNLRDQLTRTINPTDRASILGEMQILQRTIQKYERVKIRIRKFLLPELEYTTAATPKNIASIAREFLTKKSRAARIQGTGGNSIQYLERSINDLSRLKIQKAVRRNPSHEEIEQLDKQIKEREEILAYIRQNPDILKTIET